MNYTKQKCCECGSLYYKETSKMKELCPECSHHLYGYKKCDHKFKNGRCKYCYWDGSTTTFTKKITKNGKTHNHKQ